MWCKGQRPKAGTSEGMSRDTYQKRWKGGITIRVIEKMGLHSNALRQMI